MKRVKKKNFQKNYLLKKNNKKKKKILKDLIIKYEIYLNIIKKSQKKFKK